MELPELFRRRITAALQRYGVRGAKLEKALNQFLNARQQFFADRANDLECRYAGDAEVTGDDEVTEGKGKMFLLVPPNSRGLRISEKGVKKKGQFAGPGARRKTPVRAYVRNLVMIFEEATAKRMGRTYDPYAGKAKLHTFLVPCLRAAQVAQYPHGIIRDVLRELHPNAKLGRPKKS